MGKIHHSLVAFILLIMTMFIGIGYAALSDTIIVSGNASVTGPDYDVYISNITPDSSGGTEITGYFSTVMSANVTSSKTAVFTVTVYNKSDKTYIFERVIEGSELGVDGVYTGGDIAYSLSGVTFLQELAPRSSHTITLTITNPKAITTENYYLKFNYIEKTGTEILPGNDHFDITFKYNNGQPDSVVSVHENDFIPRPATPSRIGYNFIGWYREPSCINAWNFDVDRATGDMTLYAGWELIPVPGPTEFSVTFKPNNGDPDGTIIVPAGSLVPRPTSPVMDGYSFIGWYTDENCTIPWNFDTDKVNASMNLYGGWEIYIPPVPPERNITFVPNNGDPSTTIIVMTGDFIPRPTVPVRPNYTFIGWYTDQTYTTAWNFDVNKVESDMTLYGGWKENIEDEPIEFIVTFKPNNGSADSTVSVLEGDLIPRVDTPVMSGYTFIGWYSDQALTQAWNFDTDRPVSDMTLYGGWEKIVTPDPGDQYHNDFMGLVEALLSNSNNCLNDNDLIFDAVMESLTSKKRPKEDAPILHCSVNSVSGGTMSAIATFANSKLTSNLHFIFEVDPDPAYQNKRMRLYMYYGDECKNAKIGDEIMVYQQIVSRDSNGVWYADGTYIGRATVGNYFGGGNSGKDVKTVSPYTWKAGSPTSNTSD